MDVLNVLDVKFIDSTGMTFSEFSEGYGLLIWALLGVHAIVAEYKLYIERRLSKFK